ncbi:hypothetical protein BH23CYA1_BH23CYA1_23730 [soil metagenome]|uniref:hypothetical protein n=1 Tax=Leptolyngbya sp. BC1307 TaxID=2029589 RepID=UPI000EFD0335|nr:hypothetical protein [Leptolyngbya sp. BC1307]
MARRKKKSSILPKAESRLAGMQSIDAKLDLGNGMTAATFEQEIGALRLKIQAYNTLLSKVDHASNDIQQTEKLLSSLSEKMLLSVAVKYGKDSSEYEMAGGVRRSERRRAARSAARPAVAPVTAPV